MRGVLVSTNSTIHFLLRRRAPAVPSSPPSHLLPPPRRSRFQSWKPSLNSRAALQTAASSSPMEPILKNGSSEVKRMEETGESPTLQEAEYPSSSPDLPPPAPEKPEPGDCCGSGCVPCIWDVYYEELEAYTKSLEAYNMRVSSKHKTRAFVAP